MFEKSINQLSNTNLPILDTVNKNIIINWRKFCQLQILIKNMHFEDRPTNIVQIIDGQEYLNLLKYVYVKLVLSQCSILLLIGRTP